MQEEDSVHRFRQRRAHIGSLTRGAKHHVKEVFSKAHIVLRVHKRLPDTMLVAHRSECWHFRYKTMSGQFAMSRVVNV